MRGALHLSRPVGFAGADVQIVLISLVPPRASGPAPATLSLVTESPFGFPGL